MLRKLYKTFIATLRETPTLFVSVWIVLFSVAALWLVSLGIAPAALTDDGTEQIGPADASAPGAPKVLDSAYARYAIDEAASAASAPARIIIDAVGIDTPISNPASADTATLDGALASGAVRYPGSGNLEDVSNVFLFGHSSHLPVVNNPAYRAFNDIEKLEVGDLIRVQSETVEYHYRVETVEEVTAGEAWVRFDSSERRLTLSTCNNFGSKQDRFVVTASFVGSYAL